MQDGDFDHVRACLKEGLHDLLTEDVIPAQKMLRACIEANRFESILDEDVVTDEGFFSITPLLLKHRPHPP